MSIWTFFSRLFRWQKNAPVNNNTPRRKSNAERKGERGELFVSSILSQLPQEYTLLNDVVLKTTYGTTQIDHIVVSKYGVFAIETKNYRGEIYGDDDRQEWTQIILTDVVFWKKWYRTYTYVTKNHFYNPVKQSLSHVNAIKKSLAAWPGILVVPIVVFTGDVVLCNIKTQHHVIFYDQLWTTILSYKTPVLSDADVNFVVGWLTQKNVRMTVDSETHIRNVNAARQEYNNKIASRICPQCGGTLMLRNGRYGCFYGCSNYPRCRFTTH